MDAREASRLRLTGTVMRMLHMRDFRVALAPLINDTAPVFVGLPDDTVSTACQRLTDLGGSAHVIVPAVPDSLDEGMALLEMEVVQGVDPSSGPSELCPVDEGSHLAMLVELLKLHGVVTFHV